MNYPSAAATHLLVVAVFALGVAACRKPAPPPEPPPIETKPTASDAVLPSSSGGTSEAPQ